MKFAFILSCLLCGWNSIAQNEDTLKGLNQPMPEYESPLDTLYFTSVSQIPAKLYKNNREPIYTITPADSIFSAKDSMLFTGVVRFVMNPGSNKSRYSVTDWIIMKGIPVNEIRVKYEPIYEFRSNQLISDSIIHTGGCYLAMESSEWGDNSTSYYNNGNTLNQVKTRYVDEKKESTCYEFSINKDTILHYTELFDIENQTITKTSYFPNKKISDYSHKRITDKGEWLTSYALDYKGDTLKTATSHLTDGKYELIETMIDTVKHTSALAYEYKNNDTVLSNIFITNLSKGTPHSEYSSKQYGDSLYKSSTTFSEKGDTIIHSTAVRIGNFTVYSENSKTWDSKKTICDSSYVRPDSIYKKTSVYSNSNILVESSTYIWTNNNCEFVSNYALNEELQIYETYVKNSNADEFNETLLRFNLKTKTTSGEYQISKNKRTSGYFFTLNEFKDTIQKYQMVNGVLHGRSFDLLDDGNYRYVKYEMDWKNDQIVNIVTENVIFVHNSKTIVSEEKFILLINGQQNGPFVYPFLIPIQFMGGQTAEIIVLTEKAAGYQTDERSALKRIQTIVEKNNKK